MRILPTGRQLGFVEIDPQTGAPLSEFQALNLRPTAGWMDAYQYDFTPDGRWLLFSWLEERGRIFTAALRRGGPDE